MILYMYTICIDHGRDVCVARHADGFDGNKEQGRTTQTRAFTAVAMHTVQQL